MRKCVECASPNVKRSQFDYDYSTECGIQEIVISSAERVECHDCTYVTVDLGKLQEIDKKLVTLICSQSSLLTGNQSRFLRLRYFKMTLQEFATLTGIDAMTLELIEGDNMDHRLENSIKIRAIAVREITANQFMIDIGSSKKSLAKS